MKSFLSFFLLLVTYTATAAGLAGLSYETFRGTGAYPNYINLVYPTPLSTGISPTINYNWGSGNVLNSGRNEGVIVKWTGYINLPTSGTQYFGGTADDGIIIKVNNTTVVNSWIESGGDFRQGSINLTAGVYPIEVWYYENGGGALMNLYWYTSNSWQIIPNSVLATDSTFWAPAAPVLCCGGSSASFAPTPSNTTNITNFQTRTTADSQVYIEQVGNQNTIVIQQTGTKNNSAKYYGNGSNNNIAITQSSTNSSATNYTDLSVTGNSNTVDIKQQSTGGTKGVFVTINNNNNSLLLQQKDSGSHYSEVNLSGGNKNVDILQQGSGSHMAKIGLTGLPVDLSLTQSGSTQNFYSINFNCATTGGCAKITVQQGQ